MGIFDKWFGRTATGASVQMQAQVNEPPAPASSYAVGASEAEATTITFNNKNFTYSGELAGLDYASILRDKQNYNNIQSLFS